MPDVLWIDGRWTTTDEPVLTVGDRGLLFGDAVYEVLKFVGRAPILADAHWQRLCRSLSMLEIPNPWTEHVYREVLGGLMSRASAESGVVYIQVSRGSGARAHAWDDAATPLAFAYASVFRFPDEAMRRVGVGVVLVPESRWARCVIKSVNLLPNVIAKKTAKRAGAYEAFFVDGEHVVEGASSNVFVVRGGAVVTHPKGSGLLPGTVRDAVVGLAREAGIAIDERAPLSAELETAAEVFLTSTTSSVLPVTSVDGRPVGDGTRGPVTERLQKAFEALETSEAARWRE